MQISFLGTGAASSYPLAFCRCPICLEARQKGSTSFRKRSSLLVNEDLLIDLGPDSISAMHQYRFDPSKLRLLLQTHPHSDHFDPGHLASRAEAYACEDALPLEIIAARRCLEVMADQVRELEGYEILQEAWQAEMRLTLSVLEHGQSLTRRGYEITALESLHHPDFGSQIFLVRQGGQSLLYALDTPAFSEATLAALQGAALDLLIIEQTFGRGFKLENQSHFNEDSLVRELQLLREIGCLKAETQIYVTHISHEGNPHHQAMAERAAELGYAVAYDGLRLSL